MLLWALVPALALQAQPPTDDTYAQIPLLGAAGDEKLQSGDLSGALADYKAAFEASRELTRKHPQEPAYRENAYYYLGRLASTYGLTNDIPNALAMAQPGAMGYAELAATNPSPELKEKAGYALAQLSWYQLLSKDAPAAEATARRALEFAPDLMPARINLAHALLLADRPQEARPLYFAEADKTSPDGSRGRDIILDDFEKMETTGVVSPAIALMRQELGGAPRTGVAASGGGSLNDTLLVILIIGGVLLFIVAIVAFFLVLERKRTAKMEAAARALGYSFRGKATAEDRKLTAGSALTSVGRGHHLRNITEVPAAGGVGMTLFDFSYSVGHGKHSRHYSQTVARIDSERLQLPQFDLRPEGIMAKIAQSLGFRDIDLPEWPTFSKRYALRGPDEAAVRQIFTAPVVQYCEAQRGLWISGNGHALWIHRENRRAKPEDLGGFVDHAREVFLLFVGSGAAQSAPPLPPPPLPPT